MSFIIDPELLYSLSYAPEGDGEGAGGGGGSEGEGEGAKGADGTGGEGTGSGEGTGEGHEGEGEGGEGGEGEEAKLAPELEDLVKARLDKLLLERDEQKAKEDEAENEEHEFDSRILETDGKVEQSLRAAAAKVIENAKNLRVVNAEGEAVPLSNEQIDALIFGPLNEHLATHAEAQVAEAMDEYSAAYLATIPAEAHGDYLKATVDKKLTPVQHAAAYAEAMAPHTKAWKHREGEFADERATAVATATNKGFEAGKLTPGQMASQQGGKGSSGLTAEAFQKMSPEERADAWKTRPEEVRAL